MLSKNKRLFSDYLWLAVFISLLAHGVLLYYGWPPTNARDFFSAEPEIVLINYKNDEPVLNALLVAQWQAAGGGAGKPEDAASAPFTGSYVPSPNDLVLQALKQQLQQLEAEKQAQLQQLESEWQSIQDQLQDSETSLDAIVEEQLIEQAQHLAQELHVLKSQISHYNSEPRVHFDAPSTKASVFAAYIEDWRAKIERLGTEHYPDQAKGQLSDSLQLTVYLDNEGNLLKIDINQAAGNPIFTVAAQRIVRLASPFGPFSPQMREQTDVLAITRSWRFTQGKLTTH